MNHIIDLFEIDQKYKLIIPDQTFESDKHDTIRLLETNFVTTLSAFACNYDYRYLIFKNFDKVPVPISDLFSDCFFDPKIEIPINTERFECRFDFQGQIITPQVNIFRTEVVYKDILEGFEY